MSATDMALNNPLIDEYSLQGARGLLINITGGKDLTLFEVDQAVNKIRAEVDPEAELIFGAIKDENMNGRIRVSIVATSLDGQKSESNTVLNMVSRIQNRNTGYSDNLFANETRVDSNPLNSIEGATALKLDETYELNEEQNIPINNFENKIQNAETDNESIEKKHEDDITSGVSMESASYMENNINLEENNAIESTQNIINEYTPKLFSEDQDFQKETETNIAENTNNESEQLFDQDINEEEDFEIPAFLRKQKF